MKDSSSSGSSSPDDSDPDEGGANLYNFVMSNNPPSPKSLSMSQSHQILTGGPGNGSSTHSKLLFGIARRNSPANQISNTSAHSVTSPVHTPERTNGTSAASEEMKSPTLLSPTHSSSGSKVDRTTELARWMGKSPEPPRTNTTSSVISNGAPLANNVRVENIIKVQPITVATSRPSQPFQGLFAQLKKSSVDSGGAPGAPMYKRVA